MKPSTSIRISSARSFCHDCSFADQSLKNTYRIRVRAKRHAEETGHVTGFTIETKFVFTPKGKNEISDD